MGYLPSKNFIAIVGGATVAILVGLFVAHSWPETSHWPLVTGQTTSNQQLATKNQQPATSNQQLANDDLDSDGLLNWEEDLWKTDPKKADTDGDGISDKVEVKLGRDPTIKRVVLADGSWSDELKKPEKPKYSDYSQDKTLTGEVISDFMQKYLGSKTALQGNPLPLDAKAKLVDSVTADFQKNTAGYKDVYTKNDIKISKSADPKKYLNSLANVLDTNFKNISVSELVVMESFSDTRDPAKLEPLNDYIAAYKATVDFMKQAAAPSLYADLHLELLNSMQNTMLAVENMQKMPIDPIRGLVGVNLYYKEASRAHQYLARLKTQTETDKIAFAAGEPGEFFNKYFKQP